MRQRDHLVVDLDLAEKTGITLRQRFTASLEIQQDPIELFARQLTKRVSAADQGKRMINLDRRKRSNSDNLLRYDVKWFFRNPNRIERAFSHQFCGNRCLDQIVHIRRDEHTVTAPIQ